MTKATTGAAMGVQRRAAAFEFVRHPLRARPLTVVHVDTLSPRMRRITLAGAMDGFVSAAPDDHVKVLFPPPGSVRPALPVFGPQGPQFPPDVPKPVARDYTPRAFDVERGELVLDFVIHGEGPASTWAARAQPGDEIAVAGPRASRVVARDFDAFLIAADETGLPAVARWLEWIPPATPVTLLAEVGSAAEQVELPVRAGLTLRWLYRGGAEPGTSGVLLAALRGLAPPAGKAWAWIACESSQMRAARAFLIDERGWPREHLCGAGYWKRGVADHDDEH